jgi:hypothetical protein
VLSAAIGIGQFVGKGNTIKQKCLDWIAKYTADGATALFVAHTAKNVSGYIYKMVDRYLKEMKKKLAEEKVDKSDPQEEIPLNPRCKKKKEIRYEESL